VDVTHRVCAAASAAEEHKIVGNHRGAWAEFEGEDFEDFVKI